MTETRVKSFFVKKLSHVGMEVKKAQKQGRDYTTQTKINLIQQEYPIHLFHLYKVCGTDVQSSCIRLVFFCVV